MAFPSLMSGCRSVFLDTRQFRTVEGRVLVRGQDEDSGRNYLMLEATDAKVHFIHYTPEMEEARSNGEMRTNSFVRLRRINAEGVPSSTFKTAAMR